MYSILPARALKGEEQPKRRIHSGARRGEKNRRFDSVF